MTFFFDRNLGTAIPRALKELRAPVTVESHQTHFREDLDDPSWLREVGFYGWFVVTQDYKLHLRPDELDAIKQYEVGCFYLWGATATKWESFRVLARAFDNILAAAQQTERPFIFDVLPDGSLQRIELPE